jgi:uncharacterized Tic20 family protein
MQPDPYQTPQAPPSIPQGPPAMPIQPYPYLPPVPTSDEKSMAMLCHLLGILTGFLGPLILWIVKKDSSPFIDHHGREALNFQFTVLLAMFLLVSTMIVLMFILVGFLLFPVIILVSIEALVLEIIACVAASNGEWHRYPFCLRLV